MSLNPPCIYSHCRGWRSDADEFVYLLSGAVQVHLERPDGLQTVTLVSSGEVIVPRGRWHTAKVSAPRMPHVRGARARSCDLREALSRRRLNPSNKLADTTTTGDFA